MSAGPNAPVIIRRKKVVAGGGHHGGAWKVAYADFVTAMMAFFMLMWLLNATTEKQRKGIADYFSPTIPLNRVSGGGDGSLGGDSVFTEDTLAHNGIGATNRAPTLRDAGASGQMHSEEDAALKELESMLLGGGGESMADDNTLRHIVTRVTDEGLIVELFSLEGDPLFQAGSEAPMPVLRDLVALVGRVFAFSTNKVAIKGFSRSHAVVLKVNPTWDHSLDRAEAVREMLSERLGDSRMERVSGHADRHPAVGNPMSMRNDRLEIVLLRSGSGG
ncbi:flagellar motor protein MotB [Tropicimonas sediminicola]|uniref:Chemotaxis protein MotB n=1 Tax=Tropicimonas sediminicola TaxID=1031541 RepID=A0A239JFQ8_9RHOB|nr:flagellar motor protein MotB [Tropicimonas sediminicola]SNT04123.1 chemotaxis protein MotB [Tropicimonas sediminicola]